jgi:hypothetical protein
MNIFEKGEYKAVPPAFRTQGLASLESLTHFQESFGIFDTDTTVNSIRDAIVANYLGYDLLNQSKHGFDAKKSRREQYLEIKQCSLGARRWGGTWNDTNEEKARAFSDPRLFTAVALWKGASDLQFIVYGQHAGVGKYLLERVQTRKAGSRSTQNIAMETLIMDYGFTVICPPAKDKSQIITMLCNYKAKLAKHLSDKNVKALSDL